ncbi:MAG: allantoinase AllB [Nitrososphaerota archaeon]|nr:allantoinase AllB [Nitrososphaerota archaeon]
MSSLLVKGGTVVTAQKLLRADVLIQGGRITKVGNGLPADGSNTVDATGLLVLPGVIDLHVHMRDPGMTEREDFETGTAAAAAGGVTTVAEMPNTVPPTDSAERLAQKRELLAPKAHVDFALYGLLTDSTLDSVGEMIDAGAAAFKAFIGPTTGDIDPPSDATVFEALRAAGQRGVPIGFHAEDRSMVSFYTERMKASGRADHSAHSDARPSICEAYAIGKVALLTKASGGLSFIVHMSTKEGVSIVEQQKREGVRIMCETNPQYLIMTKNDHVKLGSVARVNPPLRDEEDRDALWRGIRTGVVDTIGSDHAPHLASEKKKGVWEAPSGMLGVETLLPLMLDRVNGGQTTLEKLVHLMSQRPAEIFNLRRKGGIEPGRDGDLAIVDMSEEYMIRSDELHSKQKITPFDGRRVKGRVKYTVLRGQVIYDGKVAEPAGRWVRPDMARG